MDAQVYAVPERVLFRHWAAIDSSCPSQPRSLLLKNNTAAPLRAWVSVPATGHFRLHVAAALTGALRSRPAHFELDVPAGTAAKLTVELLLPEDTSSLPHNLQDAVVVVMGPHVLTVPLRAIKQDLDPSAGGAALSAIVATLPFWPKDQELRAASMVYLDELNALHGTHVSLTLPGGRPASARSSVVAPVFTPAASSRQGGWAGADAGAPPRAGAGGTVPPDRLSAPQASRSSSDDDAPPASPRSQAPRVAVVAQRPAVVFSGRTATAVAAPPVHASSYEAAPVGALVLPEGTFLMPDGRYFDSYGKEVFPQARAAVPQQHIAERGAGALVGRREGLRDGGAGTLAPIAHVNGAQQSGLTTHSLPGGTHHTAGGTHRSAGEADPARNAALAAAFRELGISDLPPPPPRNNPAGGAVAFGGGGGAPGARPPPVSHAVLPPRTMSASATSSSRPRDAGVDDLEDDFEARLQRQIDSISGPGLGGMGSGLRLQPARPASSGGRGSGAAAKRSTSAGGSHAASRGAGEEEFDLHLQKQIERELTLTAAAAHTTGGPSLRPLPLGAPPSQQQSHPQHSQQQQQPALPRGASPTALVTPETWAHPRGPAAALPVGATGAATSGRSGTGGSCWGSVETGRAAAPSTGPAAGRGGTTAGSSSRNTLRAPLAAATQRGAGGAALASSVGPAAARPGQRGGAAVAGAGRGGPAPTPAQLKQMQDNWDSLS